MCFSGIRQLQLILLKVSLLLGVEVHTGVEFQGLNEPSGENGIFRRQPETTHLSVSLVALFLLFKKKEKKNDDDEHVNHIKVCCVYKRLDGQAAACISSGCNLPVWCLHLCWRRQVCPWWWDKHMHSTTLLLQKEGHRDVARAKMLTHGDNEPNFLWQPCSLRLLSSAHIPLSPFFPHSVRIQAQGDEGQAGYRHYGQLHQQEHSCWGPGCWDQWRGTNLQPEVLPTAAHWYR